MRFIILSLVLFLVGCGQDLSLFAVGSSDTDEMNGLLDSGGLPPDAFPPGAEWTEGDEEQAIGSYIRGALVNSEAMPIAGLGFEVAQWAKQESYGTYDMIAILSASAARLQHQFPNSSLLRVGAISRARGGRLKGHGSHQNGLDADLAYFHKGGMTGFAQQFWTLGANMVRKGVVSTGFDWPRNYAFIKNMVSTGRVARIFVDSRIKAGFCRYAKSIGESITENETLRVMRHYPGHADHMHVRLTCPQNSPRCRNQPPVPTGTGC